MNVVLLCVVAFFGFVFLAENGATTKARKR